MTKPTTEQIQRACDRANVGGADWCPAEYGVAEVLTALADTIAELDAEKARADKAVADLREIGSHAKIGADDCPMLAQIAAIAAPYRVETDPLVEAISAAIGDYIMPGAPWYKLQPELAKRGIEV